MNLKRKNLILSIAIILIATLMLPSNPSQSTSILRYKYGFPMNYITFFQPEPSSKWFGANLFTGNIGLSINPIILLINILIIYFTIELSTKFVQKLSRNN